MKIFLPTKNRPDTMYYWIGKILFNDKVAFYTCTKTLEEQTKKITELSEKYFPNLLQLEEINIITKKWQMSEINLNDVVVLNIVGELEHKLKFKTSLPAKEIIPIEYQLFPFMDFENVYSELWNFLEPRDILVLPEVKHIIGKEMVAYLVSIESKIYWYVNIGSKKILLDAITGEKADENLLNLANSIEITLKDEKK